MSPITALPDAALPTTTLPDAVLWDMDGTLVDTEPYWIAAETELVVAHGGTWTYEDGLALVGNSLLVSGEILVRRSGIDLTPAQVVDALLARMVVTVRGSAPFRPGARELLLACVEAGIPNALVTMSWTSLSDAFLASLPQGTFAAVVTGDQVEHGKPHPEPYLTMAARLDVDPARCVVLEDSPTGVASGQAAGCAVVAVPSVAGVTVQVQPRTMVASSLKDVDLVMLRRVVGARR